MGASKHVTSACLNCRRRKVKCDGNEKCSNCSMSQLTCVYNAEADLRKTSAKKLITQLRARVAQLEGELRESRGDPVQSSPRSSGTPASSMPPESTGLVHDQDPDHERQGKSASPTNTTAANVSASPCPQIAVAEPANPGYNTSPPLATSPPGAANTEDFGVQHPGAPGSLGVERIGFGLDACNSGGQAFPPIGAMNEAQVLPLGEPPEPDLNSLPGTPETESDITDILAARVGALRIAEDGELRYYGPTSNLHVQPNGSQSLSQATIRHVEAEGSEVLKRLGLDRAAPLSTEMHLARLYFAWEDPAIHVLDEDTFFTEKQNTLFHGKKSPYYSETLNNAICAIGANLALAGGEWLDLPEPAPEFFSSRAKALLDIEMDSPTVATVQALVVMSASEAAFTRDARGWLYSGMAARLSADLGLHLDITCHRDAGRLSQHDLEIRRIAFWGVFIHEHMWSMYVGRPWGMEIGNITVSRPTDHLDLGKMWKPYPAAAGHSQVPGEGIFFPLESCTDANISLCEIMRRINATLYSGQRIDVKALVDFLSNTRQDLWTWQENLAPALRIESANTDRLFVPAVLQLHMQFYATLVALYRPYLSSHFVRRGRELASHQDQATLAGVAAGCVSAAHQVAETLRCYQRQHSLRRSNVQIVHIIFTACLVFIHDVCTQSSIGAKSSRNDLQFCCHALGEIGHAYGNATRALEVVIIVKNEWQKRASADRVRYESLKRPNNSIAVSETHYTGTGPDLADGNRAKRRSRSSFSGNTYVEQPTFLRPPLFSTFHMLSDDPTSQTLNMGMPAINEAIQDVWQTPAGLNPGLSELMEPLSWPDSQELQPRFSLGQDRFSEVGVASQDGSGGKEVEG